ncbi:MAG TPA: MAPEG family protein [Parvularculaceae bacterium]|nr:MAPEG family protein [Parvularculaceae bacterium]
MTSIQAATMWIGLNIILLMFVSSRVGQARAKYKISLGDGGNPDLLRAMRTQANYVEYAWAALLGLFVLASLGENIYVIHALGAVFLLARIAHLLGLGLNVWPAGRHIGAGVTGITLLVTAGFLLYRAFV